MMSSDVYIIYETRCISFERRRDRIAHYPYLERALFCSLLGLGGERATEAPLSNFKIVYAIWLLNEHRII